MNENNGVSTLENKETIAVSNAVSDESVNISNDTKDNSVNSPRIIKDGEVSKSNVEIIKCLPDILKNGSLASLNITFNDIHGDNYNDSVNDSAGHNNVFENPVNINTDNKSNHETASNIVTVNLEDYSVTYNYLEKNQQNPYFALLITLAIFENCQYDLVCEEAKILYEIVAEEVYYEKNSDGEKIEVKRKSFDISRHKATSYFGVKFYKNTVITVGGKLETDFVGFISDIHAQNVLRCVFSEFIELRDKVTAFLISLICSEKVALYSSSINTFKRLCDINPEYFISNVVTCLLKEKSIPADVAVAQILCSIAENSKAVYSADKYLKFVSGIDKDVHYYVIILMMCKTLSYKRDKIAKLIRPILWELISQPRLQFILKSLEIDLPDEEDFINNIDLFFNIGNRYAEYYIALVSEFYIILSKMKHNDPRRENVILVILLFIKEDYNESCLNTNNARKFVDMIFIRLSLRKDICDKLIYLWSEMIKNKKSKHIAEGFLTKYLLSRNGFAFGDEYKKIKHFFMKLKEIENVSGRTLFFLRRLYTNPRNPVDLARNLYFDLGGV